MRPPWWSTLALMAAVAVVQAYIGEALAIAADGGPVAGTLGSQQIADTAALVTTATTDTTGNAWGQFHRWVGESYERAPALVLGLAALLAVPPLALAGLLMRRRRRSPDSTVVLRRSSRRSTRSQPTTGPRTEPDSWPTEAWVEIEGPPGGRFVIDRSLVRIGREIDNDIRLANKTVHRYHAVIRRTTEGEVMITDLSSADGNGVLVNGARVGEAQLASGDTIHIGEARLRFDTRPV